MPRFVVLEHRWDGVHWDFFLERGGALASWAIDEPLQVGCRLRARALPDHRLVYLDFQGPISGGRGEVRRVAAGRFEVVSWSEDRVLVVLEGDQLIGEAEFSRDAGGGWGLFLGGKVD